MKTNAITRRGLFGVAMGAVVTARAPTPLRAAEAIKVTVHRDATCGCCKAWTDRLRAAGFVVDVIDEADMKSVKMKLGVPQELASCHTAELDGYVIEGHVPIASIRRLLAEKPKALGLSVPGMPAGSPGMEGDGPDEAYEVLLFDAFGERPYGKFQGDRAL
jgi:hypothetical protein